MEDDTRGMKKDSPERDGRPQSEVSTSRTLRVYARVKPLLEDEKESQERPLISYRGREIVTEPGGASFRQHFVFSELFSPSVSQGDFFRLMVLPRLKDFLQGSNQLLFTYGASSSGKTFTVQGTAAHPGILPRSLDLIFNSLGREHFVTKGTLQPSGFDSVARLDSQEKLEAEKREVLSLGRLLNAAAEEEDDDEASCEGGLPDESAQSLATMFPSLKHREREHTQISGLHQEGLHYSLWVSFAEIYNENIYDLFERIPLAGKKDPPRRRPLRLAEDRRGSTYIKGLKEVMVSSADEAYQLLLIGRKNLQFAATKLNHNSSRSHCIFTIKIMKFCDLNEPRYGRVSILSFCDLAGSERIKKTHTDGKRQKETGNINASLLVLGRVMKTLRDNQQQKDPKKQSMVPYRDSKLTRLLQVFFKGLGQASMIVNISQSPYLFDETLQALKFAAITSKIKYVKDATSSNKSRRRSTFSSIMLQHKQSSTLMGRGSILWENPVISSTMCPANPEGDGKEEESVSVDAEEEEGTTFSSSVAGSSVHDGQYEALTNLVEELQEKLKEEKQKNLAMESDIRGELCKEFTSIMMKNEEEWQRRLQDTTERLEDLSDWRLAQMENAYKECRKRKRYEEDDDKGVSRRIASLESALEGKQVELEENNKQLRAMKETHGSILSARQKLQEELTALKFENQRIKSRVERLQEESLALSKENKSKELAIESLTSSPIIVDLRGQLADVKKKLAKKNEEVGYLKKLLDEAGEEFLSKDEEVLKLSSELESFKVESTQLSLALKDAQQECSDLMSEANKRQEENEQLEEQVIGFRTEINELLAEKSQLILEMSNLKKEKLNSCQRLERDVILKDSLENEKELNRRLLEIENENKKLKADLRAYQSESESRIEDLQSTLQNAMDTSEALLLKNKDLKSKITLLESELSVLGSLSSPTVKTRTKANIQDMSVLETKEFEKFEHCVITEELDSCKKLLAEKKESIIDKDRIIGEKDEKIAEKERIIAEQKDQILEKNSLISEKDKKLNENQKVFDEKEEIIVSKDKQLSQVTSELDEAKAKLDKELEPLRAELEAKAKYLNNLEDIIVDKNYEITQIEEQLASFKANAEKGINSSDSETSTQELESLRCELKELKNSLEAQDKTFKKTLDDKSRREKDLNDELESLRVSKLKIKSSDDEKSRLLSDKEVEIERLQKEIKLLLQSDGQQKERIEEQVSEIRVLEVQLKRLNGDSKDIEVLGKKIGEQQNLIESLQSQLKAQKKEENMIDILKEELELKNAERNQLMEKVAKLEGNSINASELARLQEKVSLLEQEALSKDSEIRQTREERENAMNNFSRLIKAKEDELARLKQESTRIRDVIIRSSPTKVPAVFDLKTELEKKEAFIKELEDKVEKTMDDKMMEDQESVLKGQIDYLKAQIARTTAKHSREIEKLKKSNQKVLQEYKAANRELNKELGAQLSDESFQQSMLEADESPDPSEDDEIICSKMEKPKRKGRARISRKNSKLNPAASPLWEDGHSPIMDESSVGDENAPLNTRNSNRSTRSVVKKTKKTSKLETPRIERNKSKEGGNTVSELSSDTTVPVEPTPRRSTRKTLYNPGKLEVFSPVPDSNETISSPHTIVNRQLRTRRKK